MNATTTTEELDLIELEQQLAYEAARSDLESLGETENVSRGKACGQWHIKVQGRYTISGSDYFGRAMRYLDAVGLLEHHPTNNGWVRAKDRL